jgi:hypothetical protein
MNLDSNLVQKTIQSLLTDVAPKVLTSPDISILTDNVQTIPEHSSSSSSSSSSSQKKHKEYKGDGEAPTITRHKTEQKNSEKKRHDDDDPVIELYEQMNAANIEFNTQTNSECLKFQESEIDIQSQVPYPESMSDKYLSREMREFIKNSSKKILSFECKINKRNIFLHFVLFKNHSCEAASYYKTYANRVFMWLHMVSLKSSCVESLNIYIYLTPFKKELPENKSEVIGPIHANTGYTYRCEKKNEIVIYRQEEWFKVFIHETMHTFGNDFETDFDHDHIDNAFIKKIFSLPKGVDIRLSETYSEIWARIMNVAFQTYFKNPPSLESKTAKQFKKNFEFYLQLESVFSLYQCIKVLDFMGVNYRLMVSDSAHSKKMTEAFYRENTNVFAYYVLTSVLLHSHDEFFTWCVKRNGPGVNMFKVKTTQAEFVDLIESCYKKNDLLQKVIETETKVARDYQKAISSKNGHKDKELVTTLRMTIVGFD